MSNPDSPDSFVGLTRCPAIIDREAFPSGYDYIISPLSARIPKLTFFQSGESESLCPHLGIVLMKVSVFESHVSHATGIKYPFITNHVVEVSFK